MFIILIMFAFICIYNMKICGPKEFNRGYISKENTTAIKGIFTFMVFMSHFTQYYDMTTAFDNPYKALKVFLKQLIVVMFLFYSGYGIFESYKRKGFSYIKQLPKNRILKVLLHLDIALVLYVILDLYTGVKIKPIKFLLSLIGWESIGNSNWFIFVILVLYLIVYWSFLLFRKKPIGALITSTVLTVAFIFVIKNHKEYWWYDTAPCFVLGLWYSFFKEKLENLFMKNIVVYSVFLVITAGAFFFCQKNAYYLWGKFTGDLLFAILVCIVTMKVSIGNKVLTWFGNHVFSVYMLQRIPMVLFKKVEAISSNRYIYFFASLIITVILSELFDSFTAVIDKKLFKAKAVKNISQEAKSE